MYSETIDQLNLGTNGLPYPIPIHPNLVHLTLGLFIIAIAFDVIGVFFPFGKPVFKYLSATGISPRFSPELLVYQRSPPSILCPVRLQITWPA